MGDGIALVAKFVTPVAMAAVTGDKNSKDTNDVTVMRGLLGHSHQQVMRGTENAACSILTGEWGPYIG